MKNLKFLTTAIFATILFISCSSNEDDIPKLVHEEEVITTLTVTLTPKVGDVITLKTQDLDGDGPNKPVITVSGDLITGTTYTGSIVLLNETENPAGNITEEVEEENKDHQFFYTFGGGLDATTKYTNFDADKNPLGTKFTLIAGSVGSGTLTFTLRHEPKKPNTGLNDAGGETDITTTFNITIK